MTATFQEEAISWGNCRKIDNPDVTKRVAISVSMLSIFTGKNCLNDARELVEPYKIGDEAYVITKNPGFQDSAQTPAPRVCITLSKPFQYADIASAKVRQQVAPPSSVIVANILETFECVEQGNFCVLMAKNRTDLCYGVDLGALWPRYFLWRFQLPCLVIGLAKVPVFTSGMSQGPMNVGALWELFNGT